jgi:hypothetical protein
MLLHVVRARPLEEVDPRRIEGLGAVHGVMEVQNTVSNLEHS